MGSALDTVNRLYTAAYEGPDLDLMESVIDPDIRFLGPLQEVSGSAGYLEINRQLLPAIVASRMTVQFEAGDEVCSIYEMDLRTPAGSVLTVPMSDWITVRDGRVTRQVVHYDTRPFLDAFGS